MNRQSILCRNQPIEMICYREGSWHIKGFEMRSLWLEQSNRLLKDDGEVSGHRRSMQGHIKDAVLNSKGNRKSLMV